MYVLLGLALRKPLESNILKKHYFQKAPFSKSTISKAVLKKLFKATENSKNDNLPMNSSTKVLKAISELSQRLSKNRVIVPVFA
ncbi:MAG: hypothetical protein HC800_02515 [Phormidesmis sp. RL_2_1]|nr:hypothetical protein [Phormidesmis sp. RL_2_1]